jgi:hypothetical protein
MECVMNNSVGFRIEYLTTVFDATGEGAGLEVLTVHHGGNRRSLFGVIYERLSISSPRNRLWISLLFISGGFEW